jgi:hypothetical protein
MVWTLLGWNSPLLMLRTVRPVRPARFAAHAAVAMLEVRTFRGEKPS